MDVGVRERGVAPADGCQSPGMAWMEMATTTVLSCSLHSLSVHSKPEHCWHHVAVSIDSSTLPVFSLGEISYNGLCGKGHLYIGHQTVSKGIIQFMSL
ncbi:hypothetical protein ACOMHN_029439 [Nucella lapillus]